MWEVTLTAVNPKDPGDTKDTTIRIYSDHWYDLLKNEHYKWGTLETMMRQGTLRRIFIDYRPNFGGVRRVRRDETDELYYLFVDGVQYGEGWPTREQAWDQGEGIVRTAR